MLHLLCERNALTSCVQFWKQFFEASANVSLSGYEELAADEEITEATDDTTGPYDGEHSEVPEVDQDMTMTEGGDETIHAHDPQDNSMLSIEENVTPRGKGKNTQPPETFATYPSSYESLKQNLNADSPESSSLPYPPKATTDFSTDSAPSTPATIPRERPGALPDMSMTPQSSPFRPVSTIKKGADPLLHRILDKNYRLQATPMGHRVPTARDTASKYANAQTPQKTGGIADWDEDSPMYSPAPVLHSEIFSSPQYQTQRWNTNKTPQKSGKPAQPNFTPGTPKVTPGVGTWEARGGGTNKDQFDPDDPDTITWDDSDDDDMPGMSPPKTMQFVVPQSKLLQTPGKYMSIHFYCGWQS
jgi:DASH complex subunit ASK1